MRFLVDANLPRRLAAAISSAGHDCDHVAIMLAPDARDLDIAGKANETGAILITKDLDLVDLSQRGVLTAPLIHVRLGNMSSAVTVDIILARLPAIAESIGAGERLIEIR